MNRLWTWLTRRTAGCSYLSDKDRLQIELRLAHYEAQEYTQARLAECRHANEVWRQQGGMEAWAAWTDAMRSRRITT